MPTPTTPAGLVTIVLACVAASVLGACASPYRAHREAPHAGGIFFHRVEHAQGEGLDYAVYVPRTLAVHNPAAPVPLVVFLHGKGESGGDGQKMLVQGIGTNILWNGQRWPCVVLFPQKPDASKAWEEYGDLVMEAVARVRASYAIDPDRIALTGLSQGGHGTWALGAAHPQVWSRLAPICGYADPLEPSAIAQRVAGIPIWCFHGDADDVVPIAKTQAIVNELQRVGAQPRFTVYPGVNHGSWDRAYAEPELPAWLLSPRETSPR